MKLVLFDIDGTLLTANGAGRRAMEAALREAFGTHGPSSYRYDGKTDRQIVRELMRHEGFDDARIDREMPRVLERYVELLHLELQAAETRVTRYAGVLEVLHALSTRDDRTIGLLTGNLERGAAAKLEAAEIAWAHFRVSAFGSDHEVRGELPAIAQQRARAVLGRDLPGDRIVIVGDTPADIDCCRGVGAKAIAVATGHYSEAELARHDPSCVLTDLSDTEAVLAAIDAA